MDSYVQMGAVGGKRQAPRHPTLAAHVGYRLDAYHEQDATAPAARLHSSDGPRSSLPA